MSTILRVDSIIQRAPDVVTAEADNDLVMVSIANGFYYSISDVSKDIWNEIEHPRLISDIISNMITRYNINVDQCQEQTLAFLENLLAEHLLLVVNETTE